MKLALLFMIHTRSFCVLLFISLFGITIHAASTENETDKLALLYFKNSILQDPQKALNSWNHSSHFCQWQGVTCGPQNRRVVELQISSRGLEGPLSPYIGNLSFLRALVISNNSFHGLIPPEIGRLFRLQSLSLDTNNFGGEIPGNISQCTELTFLDVSLNNLSGKLPQELGALSKLTTLDVQQNSFSGLIPGFLGNLTSLKSISAGQNLFHGSIPDSIGQLKNLSFLGLSENNLAGMIPPSLYNLSSQAILSLGSNKLQGSLLPNFGLMLPHLVIIQLSYNQFTGALPFSLSNCSDLELLQLSDNNFDGKIAVDFGGLKNLSRLILGQNELGSGEIDEMNFISSAAKCSNLQELDVSSNKIKGSLPNSVGNLSTQISFLNFDENQLYGRLPSTIGNLVGVATLRLQDNQFTGTIPSTIGNLVKLQRMLFQRNKFSGAIPDFIGNLTVLIDLHMEMNALEGTIPISLGNCKNLLLLELSENNLSGPIPEQLFSLSALSILLNLSGNHLHGSLPLDVGFLKSLGSLDLSKNDLSGEIPSNLGSCTSLENAFLQENHFQGSIPSSLTSLRAILNLDLSHNNLSGQIPSFFEHIPMKYLNLSFNNFEGEVPRGGVFANHKTISVAGNNKLCGGLPELHLRKCPALESKKKQGRPPTLVIVISVICTLLCLTMVWFFLFCLRKKMRKVKSSGPMSKESSLEVSYEGLFKATDGFALKNLVGRGNFGSVYKGIQVDETVVAVKVLDLHSRVASKSFLTEYEALRRVRHRNLVKIITYCSSVDHHGNEFKALVYEFMPNGSLERWLHSSPEAQNEHDELHRGLTLLQIINVAIDVACALDYLHYQCEKPIIHCDLKPSNILLDKNMVARVGDLGAEKIIGHELTDAIPGTVGYAAPEYGMGSEVSTSGDVYSYGIIILEMITRKRPTDPMFDEGLNLHNFVKMSLPDRAMEISDSTLVNSTPEEAALGDTNEGPKQEKFGNIMENCLISLVRIGVGCSMQLAQERMDIRAVIIELYSLRRILRRTIN